MNGGDSVEQREISLARFWETAGSRDYKAHEAERQAIETALNDFMGGRSIGANGLVIPTVERVAFCHDLRLRFMAGGTCLGYYDISLFADSIMLKRGYDGKVELEEIEA